MLNVLRTNRSMRNRHAQAGVGLIEVLIAVLVLSFGMLGMAGLQAFSLKSNQGALERGMAVMHTHSIADAMRADRVIALGHGFDIDMDDEAAGGTTFADKYVAAWRTDLKTALGDTAAGSVVCDGARCTITIRWSDQRVSGEADSQQQIVTVVQL
jgi:type IV pilus assembly protein PilV